MMSAATATAATPAVAGGIEVDTHFGYWGGRGQDFFSAAAQWHRVVQHQQQQQQQQQPVLSSCPSGDWLTARNHGMRFDCQYAALEGFSSGVLTQTTPTLTPTTLRSIEQTFIELQAVPPPHLLTRHSNEAGFVPPVVNVPMPMPMATTTTAAAAATATSASSSSSSGMHPGQVTIPISATNVPSIQVQPLSSIDAITTTTMTSSSSSSSSISTTTAYLGRINNGSTVTTYQALTTKSVASMDGGSSVGNNDGTGMSSSASSSSSSGSGSGSGSSTTSVSDAIIDGNSWSGSLTTTINGNGNGNGNSKNGANRRGRITGGQTTTKAGGKARNMGGRRPAKYEKLTPEEEERRRVRRERNKLAAARCRKRRMDHTNSLIYETEGLEDQRSSLQSEIQDLQSQKEELEFILEAHKVVCKMQRQALQQCHRDHHQHQHQHQHQHHQPERISGPHDCYDDDNAAADDDDDDDDDVCQLPRQHEEPVDIKPNVAQLNVVIQQQQHQAKRSRPNTLALSSTFAVPRIASNQQPQLHQHGLQSTAATTTMTTTSSSSSSSSSLSSSLSNRLQSLTEATGISITTPSNGMFNFEALMEGGTGLTPVSCTGGTGLTPLLNLPNCSNQQRSSSLSSSNQNSGNNINLNVGASAAAAAALAVDCLSSPESGIDGAPKLVSL